MEMDLNRDERVFHQTTDVCRRCGDVIPSNRYGVCERCDHDIEEEYSELYNITTMENN